MFIILGLLPFFTPPIKIEGCGLWVDAFMHLDGNLVLSSKESESELEAVSMCTDSAALDLGSSVSSYSQRMTFKKTSGLYNFDFGVSGQGHHICSVPLWCSGYGSTQI